MKNFLQMRCDLLVNNKKPENMCQTLFINNTTLRKINVIYIQKNIWKENFLTVYGKLCA